MSTKATNEKAKLKKAYIKKLIADGDPRSYNEIQADLELEMWYQQWNSQFSIEPNVNEVVPADEPALPIEEI